MPDYPRKVVSWDSLIEDDYLQPDNTDEELRQILLENGYPPEYAYEVRRLFGPSPEALAEEAAMLKKETLDKRRAWWKSEWIPFITLLVSFLSLLVGLAALFRR